MGYPLSYSTSLRLSTRPRQGSPPRSPGENRPVPTLAKSDVERAAAVMLAWMRRHGSGTVVDYHDLAEQMRSEVSRGRQPRSHLHLLRAGAERLREEGHVELWARSLRDGRWRIVWLRLAGSQGTPPPPKQRMKWRP